MKENLQTYNEMDKYPLSQMPTSNMYLLQFANKKKKMEQEPNQYQNDKSDIAVNCNPQL